MENHNGDDDYDADHFNDWNRHEDGVGDDGGNGREMPK
jgi:hypothetical protein